MATDILAAAMDAVIIMDGDGRVLYWNPAAERLFGLPADRVVGRDLAELVIPPDQRERHRVGLARRDRAERVAHGLRLDGDARIPGPTLLDVLHEQALSLIRVHAGRDAQVDQCPGAGLDRRDCALDRRAVDPQDGGRGARPHEVGDRGRRGQLHSVEHAGVGPERLVRVGLAVPPAGEVEAVHRGGAGVRVTK